MNINAKTLFKCPVSDKDLFKNSSCSVTVSMGNKAQEGDRFASTIIGINKHFKECTIMVCDSLQRHNTLDHNAHDANDRYKMAHEAGDKWIQENEKYFSFFTIPYHMIRWDYWLSDGRYPEMRSKVDHLFQENEEYRNALFRASDKYVNRLKKREELGFNYEIAMSHSLEYLKEECAVMLLWAENQYIFEIYPSERNDAMAATYRYLIQPKYPSVLIPVSLNIRTKRTTGTGEINQESNIGNF